MSASSANSAAAIAEDDELLGMFVVKFKGRFHKVSQQVLEDYAEDIGSADKLERFRAFEAKLDRMLQQGLISPHQADAEYHQARVALDSEDIQVLRKYEALEPDGSSAVPDPHQVDRWGLGAPSDTAWVSVGRSVHRGVSAPAKPVNPMLQMVCTHFDLGSAGTDYAFPSRTWDVTISTVAKTVSSPGVIARPHKGVLQRLREAVTSLTWDVEPVPSLGGDWITQQYVLSGGRPDTKAYPRQVEMGVFAAEDGAAAFEEYMLQCEALSRELDERYDGRSYESLLMDDADRLAVVQMVYRHVGDAASCFAIPKDEPTKREKLQEFRGRIINAMSAMNKFVERAVFAPAVQNLARAYSEGDASRRSASTIGASLASDDGIEAVREFIALNAREGPTLYSDGAFRPAQAGSASLVSMDATGADNHVQWQYMVPLLCSIAERMLPGFTPGAARGERTPVRHSAQGAMMSYLVAATRSLITLPDGNVVAPRRGGAGMASGILCTSLVHTLIFPITYVVAGARPLASSGDDSLVLLPPKADVTRFVDSIYTISGQRMRDVIQQTVDLRVLVDPERVPDRFTKMTVGGAGQPIDFCSLDLRTGLPLSWKKMLVRLFSRPYSAEAVVGLMIPLRNWRSPQGSSFAEIVEWALGAGWGPRFESIDS